jgi:RNA polymerase sigma-70 factor (ECF subfamily)
MSLNDESKNVRESFERLVMNHYQGIFNYIYMIVHDYDTSLDLTQDTFLRAYKAFNRLRSTEVFGVWVLKIARNLAINRLKREGRRRKKFISLFTKRYDKELVDVIQNPDPSLEEKATKDEEKDVVRKALNEINPRMREVLILKEWEDLSYEEIGKIMKISRKAVKSLIHRAREALKKKLLQHEVFSK